jgi:predicted DNA-binding transcriptional regulator AlpA
MSQNITLLSYRDLESRGYGSRVTIWRKVKDGEFPEPVDTGYGRKAWLESDIIDWLISKTKQVA